MKYRCEAVGVEDHGHKIQRFTVDPHNIKVLACEIAEKYNCEVRVFEVTERLLTTVRPEAKG